MLIFGRWLMISVIIPTKGRIEKLNRALNSVNIQTYKNFEIIVFDDGSEDADAKAIAELCKNYNATLIRNEESIGACSARNIAVSFSVGNVIAFLDSDDWWNENHLEKHQFAFRNEKTVLSYSPANLFDGEKGKIVGNYGRKHNENFSVEISLAAWNFIGGCSSVCVSRKAFDIVSGFDPSIPSCQDWSLWRKLAKVGSFHYFSKPSTYQDIGRHERITNSYNKIIDGHQIMEQITESMAMDKKSRRYVTAYQLWNKAEIALRFGKKRMAVFFIFRSLLKCPIRNAILRMPIILFSLIDNGM